MLWHRSLPAEVINQPASCADLTLLRRVTLDLVLRRAHPNHRSRPMAGSSPDPALSDEEGPDRVASPTTDRPNPVDCLAIVDNEQPCHWPD
jgi:hypothetical protein